MSGLILLVAVGIWICLLTGMICVRRLDQRRLDAGRRTLRLHFPPDLAASDVVGFFRVLAGVRGAGGPLTGVPTVTVEVVSQRGTIEHYLRLPRRRSDEILAQLRAAILGVETEDVESSTSTSMTLASELRLSACDRPLRTDQLEATSRALLAALPVRDRSGEAVVVQWTVSTATRLPGAAPAASQSSPSSSWPRFTAPRPAPTPKEWRDKQAEPLLAAVVRIGARATNINRARALVGRQVAVLRSVERPGVRFVRRRLPNRIVIDRIRRGTAPSYGTSTIVNAKDLVAVVGWPLGNPRVPGLALLRARRLSPAPKLPKAGRVFGLADLPGQERPLAISAADTLRHQIAMGPTGCGKTTLLAGVAVQDVMAGRAVIVIDPKGGPDSFCDQIADRIPAERRDDVIWVRVDDDRPVGFNVLEGASRDPERVSDEVVGIFMRRWGRDGLGPRSRDTLHAGILTLAYQPTPMSLVELPRLLTDERFRVYSVGRLPRDVILEQYWAGYSALSPGERASTVAPLLNKIRTFLLDRRVRACIGQVEPTWTMDEVLTKRRILLVSLGKGELGPEASALTGSLLLSLAWQSIRRRAVRLPASLILDEFQDLIGPDTDLAEILAQARGFGVSVFLANQHLGQLDARIRPAVMANARTKIFFQAAADNAALMARQLGGGLTADDLMGLPAFHAYLAACVGGEVLPPASLVTRPLPPALGSLAAVRAASRERYGRDRAEVEAATAARQGDSGEIDLPLGRRRRSS